jgi:DNA transformation protein
VSVENPEFGLSRDASLQLTVRHYNMATSPTTVDYLLDQLSCGGEASARKMFGEYCLYLEGKPVGLVCDEQLFLKPTKGGRALILNVVEGAPYPKAKPHFLITADLWEDSEWLANLIQVTANELPRPKPGKRKNA